MYTGTLQNGGYIFSVFATDGVGNIGHPVTFQWTVGKTIISISSYLITIYHHVCAALQDECS